VRLLVELSAPIASQYLPTGAHTRSYVISTVLFTFSQSYLDVLLYVRTLFVAIVTQGWPVVQCGGRPGRMHVCVHQNKQFRKIIFMLFLSNC